MKCKKCGQELDKQAVICVNCGCKVKKPIYKKWWVWVLVAVVVIAVGSAATGSGDNAGGDSNGSQSAQENVTYEVVDLQTMFDDLEANAMKAEQTYQGKHVEMVCKIKSFDSDGAYISVEPVNADEWNFQSALCYIKNDTQRNFLLENNVGTEITIKGKIKSIGEVLGYTIDIAEVY